MTTTEKTIETTTITSPGTSPGSGRNGSARAGGDIATNDYVLLVGDEVSFGGYDSVDGVATEPGDLVWVRNDVDGLFTPWVGGRFHYNNAAGGRYGVQCKTYDEWGVVLSSRITRVPVVTSGGHHVTDTLSLFGDPTQSGSPDIHKVNLALVRDDSDPLSADYPDASWSWVVGRNFYLYEPGPIAETVKLVAGDLSFGSSDLGDDGKPTGGGLLTWNSGGGTVAPRLNGFLHADDSQGTTIGVRMRAFDRFDQPVGDREVEPNNGTGFYVPDNGAHRQDIDLSVDADPSIHYVKVAVVVEDNNGNWDSVRTKRIYR